MLLVIVIQSPLECYTVDNDLGTKVSINKETKTKLSQTKINSNHKYVPNSIVPKFLTIQIPFKAPQY